MAWKTNCWPGAFVVFFGQCQEDGWDTSGSHVCFLLRQQIAGLDGRSDSSSPDIHLSILTPGAKEKYRTV